VLAAVLHRVAQETSRQLAGDRPDEVRLTHPAQWGPVRRNVLLSAARQAGLGTNLVLIPEPVAAAAHFASFAGRSLAPGQALAVYDLGAGTFDVAVVAATQTGFVVLAEAGLADLGGLDVDQALLEHVGRQAGMRDPARWQRLLRPESSADRRAQRALREDVKAAKESLSTHPQTEVALPEPFEDVLVTRAELEALIRPSLLRSVELMAGTIRSTGLGPDRLVGIEPDSPGGIADLARHADRADQPGPTGDRGRPWGAPCFPGGRQPAHRRPERSGHGAQLTDPGATAAAPVPASARVSALPATAAAPAVVEAAAADRPGGAGRGRDRRGRHALLPEQRRHRGEQPVRRPAAGQLRPDPVHA
jgi:hypothetical protein